MSVDKSASMLKERLSYLSKLLAEISSDLVNVDDRRLDNACDVAFRTIKSMIEYRGIRSFTSGKV